MKHSIGAALAALVVLLALSISFAASAFADRIVILTVSDDNLASVQLSGTVTAGQALDAFIWASELHGDQLVLFGSTRKPTPNTAIHYDSAQPDNAVLWDAVMKDSTGNNDSYLRYTLAQLQNVEEYDRVVVIFGQLNRDQTSTAGRIKYPADDKPLLLYGLAGVPEAAQKKTQPNSLLSMYARVNGMKLDASLLSEDQGRIRYNNIQSKQQTSFDGSELLDDLVSTLYSERIDGVGSISIPASALEEGVLVLHGDALPDPLTLFCGDASYRITTDRQAAADTVLYSKALSLGRQELRIVRLPRDIPSGCWTVDGGAQVTAALYFTPAEDFKIRVHDAAVCPSGLQQAEDGSLYFELSSEQVIRDLFLLHPDAVFQAEVKDALSVQESRAASVLTPQKDQPTRIVWPEGHVTGAAVSLRIVDADGKDLAAKSDFDYPSTRSLLDALTLEPSFTSAVPAKRQDTAVQLSAANLPNDDRVRHALTHMDAVVLNDSGEEQLRLVWNDAQHSFCAAEGDTMQFPDRQGCYQWIVRLRTKDDYPLEWTATASLTAEISNTAPVLAGTLSTEMPTERLLPGEFRTFSLPWGLFADQEGDDVTVHVTVQLNGETKETCDYADQRPDAAGESAWFFEMKEFGVWTISVTASDNEGASSDPCTITWTLENRNTAPIADPACAGDADITTYLLDTSDYAVKLDPACFADDTGSYSVVVSVFRESPGADSAAIFQETYTDHDAAYVIPLGALGYGEYAIEARATDEFGVQSAPLTKHVSLLDAWEHVQITLTFPDAGASVHKGQTVTVKAAVTLDAALDAPAAITDALRNGCSVTLLDSTEKELAALPLAADESLVFSAALTMPDRHGELTCKAVLSMAGKKDKASDSLSVKIENQPPVLDRSLLQAEDEAYLFDLSEYQYSIPARAVSDADAADQDRMAVQITIGSETRSADRAEDGTFTFGVPDFGTWDVTVAAFDGEVLSDEKASIRITVNNLTLITVIVSAIAAALIAGAIVTMLVIHNRRKPRFHGSDSIQFFLKGTPVSAPIRMPDGNGAAYLPLTDYVAALQILLTGEQWDEMKKWGIYPTSAKPALGPEKARKGDLSAEADLKHGLRVKVL